MSERHSRDLERRILRGISDESVLLEAADRLSRIADNSEDADCPCCTDDDDDNDTASDCRTAAEQCADMAKLYGWPQ